MKPVTTWGPSKRRTKRSPAPRRGPARSSSADRTDPDASRTRREQATDELRTGLDERQQELIGIGLLVGGLLLALATFFDLAGPLGRGLRSVLGWLFGFGLYAVPVVLVGVGIALIKRGRSTSPFRLAIGWALVGVAALGLMHVIWGPDGFSDLDELDDAGGVIGSLAGEPLQALVAPAGAIVVMLGLVVGGVLLITRTSLRTMAARTGAGVGSVARPIGRAARRALRDLSSLSSDDEDDGRRDPTTTDVLPALPPPTVYDAAEDFGDALAAAVGVPAQRPADPVAGHRSLAR